MYTQLKIIWLFFCLYFLSNSLCLQIFFVYILSWKFFSISLFIEIVLFLFLIFWISYLYTLFIYIVFCPYDLKD